MTNSIIALSLLAIIILIASFHYSVAANAWGFFAILIPLFFILIWVFSGLEDKSSSEQSLVSEANSIGKNENKKPFNNYLLNFRLMIFSKIILTSGLPVIVFFMCSYNFEQRLQERLKLHDYAEKIEQNAKNNGDVHDILRQIKDTSAIKSFYIDSVWLAYVNSARTCKLDTIHPYSNAESICISLLKTSRVHFNEVSGTTQNFELLKPFGKDSNQFAFNSIFNESSDTLKYTIREISGNSAVRDTIVLSSSGSKICKTPCIFNCPEGLLFWVLLFVALIICYQLLKYATNKIFGKNIPATDDFKYMHVELLKAKDIKYLFVQGIPGSDKTSFIKNNLEADKFIFYDNTKPDVEINNEKSNELLILYNKEDSLTKISKDLNIEHRNVLKELNQCGLYNAKILNLEEIPDDVEINSQKANADKPEPDKSKVSNWDTRVAELESEYIECIVFAHFEYKILDERTNRIKLNLIEKFIQADKKKIIISSDIDPVEYFHSLKKFMYGASEITNKKADPKKDAKESGSEKDANAAFFEYMNRWNNLLGRFTNIYTENNASAVVGNSENTFVDEFLATECSHPKFLNKYKLKFKTLAENSDSTEDNILKIQSLSDHSYRQIWASLTKEEQLTLYDLAEDGLVNTTNYMSITMLLNKGLVMPKDGVLIIMNRSFRNFVLTIINPGEVKSIEKEISDGQTWSDYKYPVLIILGALVYFVLSSNPEKFGNILPLISGVMAGIPTVLKLLSFLKPADGKS